MKDMESISDFKAYLQLFEMASESNKLDLDKEKMERIYNKFKIEIEKIAKIRHDEIDKEIEELENRVDRLFGI